MQAVSNPFVYVDPRGKFTLTLLSSENPNKVGRGGSWNTFPWRPFLSYLCWMFGGHNFVEREREYHYDSSETAHTYCTRCRMWVPF